MTEQVESGQQIGTISHFFSKISVSVIELTDDLRVGETIRIQGHTTDLVMTVESMQIENNQVEQAKPGDSVGVKVPDHVREGDRVYRVESAA